MEIDAAFPAPGLVVWQPKRGYRYGVEVYVLAHFALRIPAKRVVDLGGGSGVISLLMAAQGAQVTMLERESAWVELARRSVTESKMEGRVTVEEADVRTWQGSADLVVTNPPWFPAEQPRSPDVLKAAARSMINGSVEDFAAAGLRIAPRVCLVTRPERAAELAARGWAGGACARRARVGDKLVLLELRREPTKLVEEIAEVEAAYERWGV